MAFRVVAILLAFSVALTFASDVGIMNRDRFTHNEFDLEQPFAYKYDFAIFNVTENSRNVRLFWQGSYSLHVKIFEENELIKTINVTFGRNIDLLLSLKEHTINLHFQEWIGDISEKFTMIKVPAQNKVLKISGFVTSLEEEGYHYYWRLPQTSEPIVNISMIWCDTLDSSIRTCVNVMGHLSLNRTNATDIIIKFNSYKGIALRVDTEDSSSGIIRPQCENVEEDVGALSELPNVTKTNSHVLINWPLDCPEEAIVFGVENFQMYYSIVTDVIRKKPKKQVIVYSTETALKAEIELIPDSRYKIVGFTALANGKKSKARMIFYKT